MAEKLTPQQRCAVENRGGKLLVSAAAGSGKTKVLVDRILGYLNDPQDPANLDDFLIITYTKAAASELRGKIAAKLNEAIAAHPENRHLQKQMQRLFLTKISTVHGFCADVLRQYAYRLDLSADFRVADENECTELRETVLNQLLDRAYEQSGENDDFRAFVDSQGLGRDDLLVSEIVLQVYDSARCHLNPERWLQECVEATDVDGLLDAGQTIWGKYLMDHLFSLLDSHIHVLNRCLDLASQNEKLEKVSANLTDTLFQLKRLREAKTWDEIVRWKDVDFGKLSFPRKDIDPEVNEIIKTCRNSSKKSLEKQLRVFADPSEVVLKDLEESAAGTRGLVALVRQFGAEYDRAKQSRHCLDFGDLEHKMLDLVLGRSRTAPTAAAREIGKMFREIMVDEYQDSNGVQDAIVRALTDQRKNCFMVGDVKQSIYQFRLADPGIFLDKYSRYPDVDASENGKGRKVLLSANFRSGGEVVDAVNDVFTDCMSPEVGGLYYGEAEKLREGVPHRDLPDSAVELHALEIQEDTYEEESAYVAQRIRKMLDEGTLIRDGDGFRPVTPDDLVILLRSPGSVGHHYQRALEKKGIRCTSGGGTDLLKTPEIATLRSLLQTVANPRQDIPLLSVMASPVFGFTAEDLAAIRSKNRRGSVYDAVLEDKSHKTLLFLNQLSQLRKAAPMHSIAQLIRQIFTLTRMDSIYLAMEGGEVAASNLQTFYDMAADFEAVSRRDLTQFLEYLNSMEEKGLKTDGEDSTGAVTIMSIHKSKGLEFPVVFLCGLGRSFNRENLRAQVLCDKELYLGLSVADRENRVRYPGLSKRAIVAKAAAESLSEEMRVLYVAMTRARDRLVMTYSSENLTSDLKDIALRGDICGAQILTREVSCPGKWVLFSALRRTEAGMLHNMGGRPAELRMANHPWLILTGRVIQDEQEEVEENFRNEEISAEMLELLQVSLDFRYPHQQSTKAPSKQTATQRKGRSKDSEAAENTHEPVHFSRSWRRPGFSGVEYGGKTYGNAVHAAMQYLDYSRCGSADQIREELGVLVRMQFLTQEQAGMVDCQMLAEFFTTDLGRKLRGGVEYIREFKFSILDDGSNYGEGLEGERVLLQGVVDCALLEEDGITILDFKTDYVTEDTLPVLTARYQAQIRTYEYALSRIYGKKVKASCLYFFKLGRLVCL